SFAGSATLHCMTTPDPHRTERLRQAAQRIESGPTIHATTTTEDGIEISAWWELSEDQPAAPTAPTTLLVRLADDATPAVWRRALNSTAWRDAGQELQSLRAEVDEGASDLLERTEQG